MKKILEAAGVLLILQGAGSVAHHFADWFRPWTMVHRIGFLDGYEVFAGVVLIMVGLAACAASEKATA
ncbi:hypothetical protein [Streptomyces sp. NBC_01803]|uniref:hypothetical protein n=1 Tax=Streptomyces sp. NBC_01803 TaxID=2975946 RepID=UPI002DDB11EA|nr:hypothetical protein [Streptomyces sp. NBC_01803]WSA42934.1 hypothetical protein OIE51_01165 [Streptomyces sp. NBC_01803]